MRQSVCFLIVLLFSSGCVSRHNVPAQPIDEVIKTMTWQQKQVQQLLLPTSKPLITDAGDADRLLQWWASHDVEALAIFEMARTRWLDQESIELFTYASENESQVVVMRAVNTPGLFVWLQFNRAGFLTRAGHLSESPAAVRMAPDKPPSDDYLWSIYSWRLLSVSKKALGMLTFEDAKPLPSRTAWLRTEQGWHFELQVKMDSKFGVQSYLYQAQLLEDGVLLLIYVLHRIE